jgi:transposase InsO family protein
VSLQRFRRLCSPRWPYFYRDCDFEDLHHITGLNGQRIWRAEGLKVPRRQPKRGRLWLNDGSCIRLRPEHANHVWAYDFVSETTHDGRKLRLLTVVDEYTRECLTIRVERRMTANVGVR